VQGRRRPGRIAAQPMSQHIVAWLFMIAGALGAAAVIVAAILDALHRK
jgi:hypothetical protein